MKIICPVCGKYEFDEPGDWRYCKICGWQNDSDQFENHDLALSTNELSINQMKTLFALRQNEKTQASVDALVCEHTSARRDIHTKYTGADCTMVNTDSMKLELKYEYQDFVKKLEELAKKL